MDRHCPVFILECAATFACEKFITGSLPLDLICKKISNNINTEYKKLQVNALRDVTETFLRSQADANGEE